MAMQHMWVQIQAIMVSSGPGGPLRERVAMSISEEGRVW